MGTYFRQYVPWLVPVAVELGNVRRTDPAGGWYQHQVLYRAGRGLQRRYPLRSAVTLTNPFATTSGSSTITVTDANGGYISGDYVSFYGSTAIGGITLLGEYSLSLVSTTSYTVSTAVTATISSATPAVVTSQNQLANGVAVTFATTGTLPSPLIAGTTYYVVNTSGYTFQIATTPGGTAINTSTSTQNGVHTVTAKATTTTASGGGTVRALYQINVGPSDVVPSVGWGAGTWGKVSGVWVARLRNLFGCGASRILVKI